MNLNLQKFTQASIQSALEYYLGQNFRLWATVATLRTENANLEKEMGEAVKPLQEENSGLRGELREANARITDFATKGYLPEQLKDLADRNRILNEIADPNSSYWDKPPVHIKRLLRGLFEGLTCDDVAKEELAQRITTLLKSLEKAIRLKTKSGPLRPACPPKL